jgi:murein DD-endopeptidase MepM/ murein hydrolase activator NlpD
MTSRAVAAVAAVVCGVAFVCVGGLLTLTGAATACSVLITPTGTSRHDAAQLHHARIIVAVGVRTGIPVRGHVIAVATALQESGLRNLGHLGDANDHDSLGLFQQRPSQGWGTPAQILDPAYAASAFYRRLVTIAGWQTMPLTVAAQRVQRSAYPDAYAKWEGDATVLVGLASGSPASGSAGPGQQCVSVGGWTKPVQAAVGSGFRTGGRPGHDGVDLTAPRGTPVHAAASGLVIRVICNARLRSGRPYSCDVDGHPVTVVGCGWYVEVLHPDSTVTRYCHLLARPPVEVGQQVAVGQVIGLVGSSGHSSGPHLHLQTHTHRPATEANAVDPIAFFAQRGVDLRAA